MSSAVGLATHEWAPSAGTEPRLAVLVHGVAGWHRTWWRIGPALAGRGWRVIALDQRGHGASPRIGSRTTVAELADDLGAAIRRIGAPVDALIGHSLGAAVSAELAHQSPELVPRLVLEDPPAITRVGDVAWLATLEGELLAANADFDGEVSRELRENPGWRAEDARQDVEGKQLADRDGIVASFRSGMGARVLELAPRMRVPVLYLLAAEDRSVFPRGPRRLLQQTLPPQSRVVVLDGGHTLHRDCFDDYVATIVDFLG